MNWCSLDERRLSEQKLLPVSSNYLKFFKNMQFLDPNPFLLLKDVQSYDLICL